MTKTCAKCGEVKECADFNRNARTKDGLQSWCRPCSKLYKKKWNADNSDHVRTYSESYKSENVEKVKTSKAVSNKSWNARNPDRRRALRKAWQKANPEKYRATITAWQVAHPEAHRVAKAKRRQLEKAVSPQSDRDARLWRELISILPCGYCGGTSTQMHTDHIIPLSRGGLEQWDNLVRACQTCNLSKSNKTLEEWGGSLKCLSLLNNL